MRKLSKQPKKRKKKLKPGIYPGIPFADYLLLPYISNSYLGRLDKCPAAAKAERVDTPALQLGRIIHKYVLEDREAFEKEYLVAAKCNRRTAEGKTSFATMQEMAKRANCTIISKEDFQKAENIRAAVYAHPFAVKLLASGISEQTVIWQEPSTGEVIKCRPDILPDENKLVLVDLKTTKDASEHGFSKSVAKYGYARQAALYLDGITAVSKHKLPFDSFVFIAVETDPPFRVEIYALDDEFIEWGRREYLRLIKIDQKCRNEASYPHYSFDGIIPLFKPHWLL